MYEREADSSEDFCQTTTCKQTPCKPLYLTGLKLTAHDEHTANGILAVNALLIVEIVTPRIARRVEDNNVEQSPHAHKPVNLVATPIKICQCYLHRHRRCRKRPRARSHKPPRTVFFLIFHKKLFFYERQI